MSDVWRVVGEAPKYEVSRNGRVRNIKTGRVLKTCENNSTSKPQVTLMHNGKRLTRLVHTLQERAFGY